LFGDERRSRIRRRRKTTSMRVVEKAIESKNKKMRTVA
jgi:hypothetical protein